MIADLTGVVGIKCDKAHMTGLCHGLVLLGSDLVYLHLVARQSQKTLICQIVVRHHNVVVGVCDNGVTVSHISPLQSLGGELTVGNGGMAMKISLVKFTCFGKKILFHFRYILSVYFAEIYRAIRCF